MKPGERYRLRHDVDRYPHFIAPAGAVGTIVDVGDPGLVALKMDEVIPGAETWDNEVQWYIPNGDNPMYDLVKEEPVTKPLVCRNCGSDNIVVWYTVPERQGIEILGLWEDGTVSFDFDGVTETTDANSDDQFWCMTCDFASSSLEYLLGVTDDKPKEDDA